MEAVSWRGGCGGAICGATGPAQVQVVGGKAGRDRLLLGAVVAPLTVVVRAS